MVPPPTAEVGEEITWPTSTGLEIIVASSGDFTKVSSRAIFAFSTFTIDLTCCDFAEAKLSCISSKFLSAILPSVCKDWPLISWAWAFSSLTSASFKSAAAWSSTFFGVLWSIWASINPLSTKSPTSAPKNKPSPDAFDFISTDDIASITPDASIETSSVWGTVSCFL